MTDPTADAAKLLPCPFCGAYLYSVDWHTELLTGHTDECYLYGYPLFVSDRRRLKQWNTRPQPAPPVEKKWDSEAGCMGTGASVTVAAPPAGEPDFMRDAETFARKENAPFGVERLLRQFGERMYRLGLAARPKIEDAEAAARLVYIDDTLRSGVDVDHQQLALIRDLLERLAAEKFSLSELLAQSSAIMQGYLDRADAAEAELAKADAVIAFENGRDIWDGKELDETFVNEISIQACNRHAARKYAMSFNENAEQVAARQQQKASAEPASSKAGETR